MKISIIFTLIDKKKAVRGDVVFAMKVNTHILNVLLKKILW